MQLIILDKDFQTLGPVSLYQTLLWTRRYYEPGAFGLYSPPEFFALLKAGKYLYRSDRTELGLIEDVVYTRDDQGRQQAYCSGSFAEALLNSRVIRKQVSYTGTPEAIARKLVNANVINPSDASRKIPGIVLGTQHGLGTSVEVSATGEQIGDKLYEIEAAQQLSHRLIYDYLTNALTFDVWQGKDRTDGQTANSWAIFSDGFFNLRETRYERDEKDYKNFAVVAGEGEGSARKIVTVDIRPDPSEEMRELYVDARDLQSTYMDESGVEHTYSTTQYNNLLRQRGREVLAEYAPLESVENGIDPNANLIYMVDFDLGDLCVYRNSALGIETQQRIIEIRETYEGASFGLDVVFGAGMITSISKLIRREAR